MNCDLLDWWWEKEAEREEWKKHWKRVEVCLSSEQEAARFKRRNNLPSKYGNMT